MSIVRSVWPGTTIPLTGMLPDAEWASAGNMSIPGGRLLVKNDDDSVYIELDITADTGNDPGSNDYYWFVIDIDNNGAVTPNRDMLFSPWPGDPNRLGLWMMAYPNACWPAQNTQVILSSNQESFGTSPQSSTNHRIWKIRLKLSELGITIDPQQPAPILRFGLHVTSGSPAFTYESPANPMSDFQHFNQIILATSPVVSYSAGTAGIVIGGVGFIPATNISADGYASITQNYRINPDEAAFGGVIDLIGNTVTLSSLWKAGARKYKVLHRSGNTQADLSAAQWAPIQQIWSNFRWNGQTYVWESFSPDSNNMYPLVDPAADYSIKALLLEWTSTTFSNNLHQFQIQFFKNASVVVRSPSQILTLRLDNYLPTVKLIDIQHNGKSIAPCGIETMTDNTDGLQFIFEAFDPEGDLCDYVLTAEYGAGERVTITSDSYAAHRLPTHIWQGVTSLTYPALPGKWVPPKQCAYLFRIAATARVTNGYYWPYGWVSDFRTVTILKQGGQLSHKPIVQLAEVLPNGLSSS